MDKCLGFRKSYSVCSYLLLIFILAPLAGCTLKGGPVEGRVLDAETKMPIAGAIVIARWEGTYSQFVDTQDSCFHADSAITDEQGHFRMPDWREWTKGPLFSQDEGGPFVSAFKIGYRQYLAPEIMATDDYQRKNIRHLEVDPSAPSERLAYLKRLVLASGCHGAGISERRLYPFYEALYFDAKKNASTPEDLKDLQWFRKIAASKAVSEPRRDRPSVTERVEEFLKDHLQ